MRFNATSVAGAAQPQRLHGLAADIDRAVAAASTAQTPAAVAGVLAAYREPDELLTPAQQAGNAEHYARHLLYAHPLGRFSIVALAWQPGQCTPVHGHFTWCAYAVLRGAMQEEQYDWDAAGQCALATRVVARAPGDCVASLAGLDAIHRLRNVGAGTAISLHVYGVEGDRVATHVNRIARAA
ncbi:Predicted metal-dependent enzyme of the double-stranded beta helix superfamily [Bordetella pertussis]|uniref:Cysteine dioxygenase n=11 Tax=Bordetella pertussis TaxID=520 RepID=Q7VV35_BORPE|nr:cysteine dioxygenase family protein [Bordetella pertussis]ETH40299.1 cysteine dioxygenase type I domain protein [Bordetella pertussis H918]ETH43226.1 cysteine dioxygenase type I domain protein [Bordetella pertussis H939]ETH47424.1 cysteine dioxygenase type I domain protein [Bordetella pertussis H921]ETH70396.1 cysteine dioxygenase type I domain protein [Bordetella pertussis STO1-CHLA-0011]ETH83574.1 cysteine dioxygenase type I domain protein [Bordetella pertussis STO1-CHOC-0017]ETH89116.1 